MSGPIQLKTPLGDEVLALRAGDHVELSGLVYTARDEAHLRMQEAGIPFDPRGAVIYHCGPVMVQEGGRWMCKAAGPTTSTREEPYQWEVMRDHVLPYAAPGVLTGTMLSLARALGEAAPLILIGAITGLLPRTSLDGAFTALHIACKQGRLSLVRVLLEKGAQIDALDRFRLVRA